MRRLELREEDTSALDQGGGIRKQLGSVWDWQCDPATEKPGRCRASETDFST
jgi:hypothetical protein